MKTMDGFLGNIYGGRTTVMTSISHQATRELWNVGIKPVSGGGVEWTDWRFDSKVVDQKIVAHCQESIVSAEAYAQVRSIAEPHHALSPSPLLLQLTR